MGISEKLSKDKRALWQIFKSRTAAVLFGLGFASGLPLALSGGTLTYWLEEAGVPLVTTGIFGMLAISYSLKFLWAPLLDRFQVPLLGRRRGWIFVTQLALIFALVGAGLVGTSQLGLLALFVALIAFFSASQDIVIDGYRADLLSSQDVAMGSAVFLLGYRVAMLASTAGSLFLADAVGTKASPSSWWIIYAVMGALMLVGVLAVFWGPEPSLESRPPSTIAGAFEYPFLAFLRRRGAFLILLFIFVYKLADTLMLTGPFYLRLGFSKTEIAAYTKFFGAAISMVGITVGGIMAAKIGVRRSLFWGGIATAVANLSFTLLALVGQSWMLLLAISVDNFCSALVSTPFLAFLVGLCDKKFSATQFALFASVTSMGGRLLSGLSGVLAQWLGWPIFFAVTVVAAIPGLMLLGALPLEATAERESTEDLMGEPCLSCKQPVMQGLSFCDNCGELLLLSSSQKERLLLPLLTARRWLLGVGFSYAATGIFLPLFLAWEVKRFVPFIVIHFSLLTVHIGLWAWAKLEPARAVLAAAVILLGALGSDLFFRVEFWAVWAPLRVLTFFMMLKSLNQAKIAQGIFASAR